MKNFSMMFHKKFHINYFLTKSSLCLCEAYCVEAIFRKRIGIFHNCTECNVPFPHEFCSFSTRGERLVP